jgi:hypothetical protein
MFQECNEITWIGGLCKPYKYVARNTSSAHSRHLRLSISWLSIPLIKLVEMRSVNPIHLNIDDEPMIDPQLQANPPRKRKMMTLANGEQVPEPHWSYRKPTTRVGMMRELYGHKVPIYKRARRLKPGSMSLFFSFV